MSSVVVPLNPFSDQIVTSPRRAEPSVQGLNDQALQRLVGSFTAMELPPRRGGRIHLVTSPSGGYGKSHLTGRLYRELGRRATQIYVRPFSDPDTHWVSLLHTIIQEMMAPEFTGEDEEEIKDRPVSPPTQLDAFVHGVFASVLISLLDSGEFEYGDPEFVRDRLRNRTFVKWDLGDPQSNWGLWASDMLQRYEESESRESRVLKSLNQSTGNHLGSTTRPQAWLRVMRRFAANRGATALRDQCLEWMRARTPMIELVTKPLGLLATDGVDSEGGIAARNSMARSRVLDLLTLGRLFRPFVICFDQTEVFGRVPGLARAFGGMLSDLVQCEGAQFTVVTANQEIWNTQLSPSIEVADRDRILPGMELTGLSYMQGRELALNRLRQTRLPVELQELVLSPDWVAYQFGNGLLSPRDFLRRCEQRYEEIVPAALAQPPRPKLMLGELFAEERQEIESDPRESKDFRADALRWALLTVPDKAGADFKATPCRTDVASYTAEWKSKSGLHRYLVLEPSSHTLVWQAIFRKGATLRAESPGASVVALRIEGQGSVPHDNQAAHVQSNKASGKEPFRVYTFSSEDLSKVYAGWELYLQACQGDIDYSPEQVLAYVFDRLVPVYSALLGEQVVSTLPPELGAGVTTAALPQAPATFAMPAPAPAPAPVAQPAVAPAYTPPSFLTPGAGSLAAAVGTPAPAVAASIGGLKSPEETAPIHKTAIKITSRVDGLMQSPAPAAAPMTFPPPSGLKPVEPMAPQAPLLTAPAPSPAVPSAPAPSTAVVTAPAGVAPAAPPPPAPPPAPAYVTPTAVSPDTDKIVIASVTDILGAPTVRPDAFRGPSPPSPAPAPIPAPAAPLPPPAPAQSFAQFIPPPTGFTVPPKPVPPQGAEPTQDTSELKPGQKAFPVGSPAASSTASPAAQAPAAGTTPQPSAAAAAPAASTPPRPAAPTPSRPGGETPRPAAAVPPPNAGAPSKSAAAPPAIAAKPLSPAPVSKQSPAAAPAVGGPKPGVPGRPTGPTPGGGAAPAPRPAAPGAPTARGPMPAQPGSGPRAASAPPAPSAAPTPPAEEKAGFFGRIGKMFKKETSTPVTAAAPAAPRRPMPAATAARLAGAVPPGAPPGARVPGAPAAAPAPGAASKHTEPVAVIPVTDDDSPEAAVRPAEVPPKKSLTEASPAKDASVENKTSATESPETTQATATVGDVKAEPAVTVEQAKTPGSEQATPASVAAPAPTSAPVTVEVAPRAASVSPEAGVAAPTPAPMAKSVPASPAEPPFVATPASTRQHPSQPWTFSNEAMTKLAELLHPKTSSEAKGKANGKGGANGHGNANTNGNGHSNGKAHANGHGESPHDEEEPLSQSPSHEAMVWLAHCLREYQQERDAPEGNRRVAMFAKEEAHVAEPLIPAAVLSEVASPPSFEKVMRDLVKARRLISYPMLAMELEKRLARSVSMEEANAAAKASGDIHVYGEGNSAGYLWQGR